MDTQNKAGSVLDEKHYPDEIKEWNQDATEYCVYKKVSGPHKQSDTRYLRQFCSGGKEIKSTPEQDLMLVLLIIAAAAFIASLVWLLNLPQA